MNPVDLVIPIYDGLEETRACIDSVLATVDPAWVRLVLVNDCSPNPAITELLRAVADCHEHVVLLENEVNLGFVATANRGMAHDDSRDVLLLNSDVEVANDWLQRLREAAYRHPKVASLTPFANNATIFSFPDLCKDNPLLLGLPLAEIDRCFADNFTADDVFEVPTGVGCCMYLRRDCLREVGLFDLETFGKGYGEENDWSQRALKAGWKNYHLANCFIYHKGGVSFSTEQNPRVQRAQEILDQRYPRYHADVQRYIASDPAHPVRTRALLTLFAAARRPKVAFLSHKLGGGAQQHVNELASLYAEDALFLQITPDEDGRTVTLSFFCHGRRLQDGLYFEVDRDYDKLAGLLSALGVGHLHFHHTMGLHPRLWVLAEAIGCRHDLTIHDYYLINGNPTLTDNEARFVDEAAPDFDQRCASHYPLPEGVSGEDWRRNQDLLVTSARRVIFPSRDCAERFGRYFKVAEPVVAYHPDYLASQPYPAPGWRYGGDRSLKVLVLGAISREKGADVLDEVATALVDAPIEFHLLGYAYRALGPGVITHGPYDNDRVYQLVEEIDPDVVWYPALWPETYSYTLSIGLHQGLPVVVPDIGAFAERVQGRPHSVVRPWDCTVTDWVQFWQAIQQSAAMPDLPAPGIHRAEPASDFYSANYLRDIPPRQGEMSAELFASLEQNLHAGVEALTRRERLLGGIWRLSRKPLVAKMISVVPFRMQQAIKRRLSARPMHDIVR